MDCYRRRRRRAAVSFLEVRVRHKTTDTTLDLRKFPPALPAANVARCIHNLDAQINHKHRMIR